jgi:quercetin dioxygenase-like cupin family protein
MNDIQIQHDADAVTKPEYGGEFRRILPWGVTGPSDTGVGVFRVAPGATTTPHSHVDYEHFYMVRGHARIYVDGGAATLSQGDAVVVASQQVHYFENLSDTDEVEMVTVWSLGPFGAE